MSSDPTDRSQGTLSPRAAFVVQFLPWSDPRSGVIGGRVEHVASGRSRRFASLKELLDFLADALTELGPGSEDPPA